MPQEGLIEDLLLDILCISRDEFEVLCLSVLNFAFWLREANRSAVNDSMSPNFQSPLSDSTEPVMCDPF